MDCSLENGRYFQCGCMFPSQDYFGCDVKTCIGQCFNYSDYKYLAITNTNVYCIQFSAFFITFSSALITSLIFSLGKPYQISIELFNYYGYIWCYLIFTMPAGIHTESQYCLTASVMMRMSPSCCYPCAALLTTFSTFRSTQSQLKSSQVSQSSDGKMWNFKLI